MSCGADTTALDLLESLKGGSVEDLPAVDLSGDEFKFPDFTNNPMFDPVDPVTNEALTEVQLQGKGIFDVLMRATSLHLAQEYEKNRITGDNYAKVYVGAIEANIGAAIQFILQRDQARWAAIAAQAQAKVAEASLVQSRIQLETTKAELYLAQQSAENTRAQAVLTKMKIATEDATYCAAKFQLEEILPLQKELQEEQVDAQRAQTKMTLRDGTTPIDGLSKRQRDLLEEQKASYEKDAMTKAARIYADTWITQKGMDEGVTPPNEFTNPTVNTMMLNLRTLVGAATDP